MRLIPIVLFAAISLLVFKTLGIVSGTGYTLAGLSGARAQSLPPPQPLDANASAVPVQPATTPVQASAAKPKRSWAQEMLGYPEVTGSVSTPRPPAAASQPAPEITGAAAAPTPPPAAAPSKPLEGTPASLSEKPQISAGERAVLERLQERRQELEARARELDIREGLVKAAEKRLEARLYELKQLESRASATGGGEKKTEADNARLKSLASMYENMKPKEAARIFDRLDMKILIEVAALINPRRMSEIMAQMSPDAAEKLTVELASRAGGAVRASAPDDLPKIQGRPRS